MLISGSCGARWVGLYSFVCLLQTKAVPISARGTEAIQKRFFVQEQKIQHQVTTTMFELAIFGLPTLHIRPWRQMLRKKGIDECIIRSTINCELENSKILNNLKKTPIIYVSSDFLPAI